MELLLHLSVIALCFVLIVKGGDLFLNAAIRIAEATGIPQALIGATIVSVGTTLPELFVSTVSAVKGDYGLSLTNSVGSMFCNVALVLGVALAAGVTTLSRRETAKKAVFVTVAAGLTLLFAMDGRLTLIESVLLLALFVVFLVDNVRDARHAVLKAADRSQTEHDNASSFSFVTVLFGFVIGALSIGLGAKFLVDHIQIVAVRFFGISTSILGISVVAVGTSLPELVTAVQSVRKKSIAVSFGNVMGANVINGTLIAGLSGTIGALSNGSCDILSEDLLFQLSGSPYFSTIFFGCVGLLCSLAVLFVPLFWRRGKTARFQGFALLAIYLFYLVFLILKVCSVL